MTGDGELQEGQIWESLQPAANERLGEIIVVVDHNKLQSDSAVSAVSDLGPIEDKFRAFGWEVQRADGHDLRAVRDVFEAFALVTDRPKVLIADTVKGKGVSFMEGLACGDPTYHFHAGAPSLKDYLAAVDEIASRVNGAARRAEAAGRRAGPRAAAGSRRAVAARTPRGRLRRRAAADGPHAIRYRRPRRRSAVGLRHRSVQSRVAGAIHRVRHRRAAHGVGGRRHGAPGVAAGRALVRVLPVDARQRAHLQQRDRAPEDHLHRDAGRRHSGRTGPFASVGSRHLGDRIGARADGDRAVLRARIAPRDPVGRRAERRQHVPALRQRAARSAVRAAAASTRSRSAVA